MEYSSGKLELTNEGSFKWGIEFSEDIKSDSFRKKFLDISIKALVNEFNIYCDATHEVPWWFNERALLGFYAQGLARTGKIMGEEIAILQEYVCYKSFNQEPKESKGKIATRGRADLWLSCGDRRILFESKVRDRKISILPKIEDSWEKEALDQAEHYLHSEPEDLPIDYLGSLCFTCLWQGNKTFDIHEWRNGPKFGEVPSFYCFVQLNTKTDKAEKPIIYELIDGEKSYYYPALCISGILKKIRRT